MVTEWEIPDFDKRLAESLQTGKYINVYPYGKLPRDLEHLCEDYSISLPVTRALLTSPSLDPAKYVVNRLLHQCSLVAQDKAKDVYVVKCTTHQAVVGAVDFRLRLKLLGDVEYDQYYYDKHLGEIGVTTTKGFIINDQNV